MMGWSWFGGGVGGEGTARGVATGLFDLEVKEISE